MKVTSDFNKAAHVTGINFAIRALVTESHPIYGSLMSHLYLEYHTTSSLYTVLHARFQNSSILQVLATHVISSVND